MSFTKDFIWGAASASYQIEGGAFEDGKGPSIWDQFSHTPGKTFGGHTGDVAADAYHRFEEDLDLMQQLGIRHYRFSISWPRVFPKGTADGNSRNPRNGAAESSPENLPGLNPAGIAYYDKVVDGCLARGITPWITLYHWDLPLALYENGGWLNRETAYHFADYAAYIAAHFRGRVNRYITINEPQCAIGLGMGLGTHAPGLQLGDKDLFKAWHHLLLAHGLAVRAIRDAVPDSVIGVASTGALTYLTEATCTQLAEATGAQLTEAGYLKNTPAALADAAFVSLPADQNPGYFFNHQWFLDPVFLGHYPDDPEHPWTAFAGSVSAEDMEIIASPIDFAGLNIYNGHEMVPADTAPAAGTSQNISDDTGPSCGTLPCVLAEKYPGYPRTALKWPVTPEILYWGPRLIYERYGKPVCIMEDGQSCNDRIFLDGKVHDPDRIDFLHRYLRELRKAVEDGIPVQAYFHWALTDNFEWNSGYDERFGLIYIDYRDQRRIPKDSAFWYAKVIETNGDLL